jgi:hypothetical protein
MPSVSKNAVTKPIAVWTASAWRSRRADDDE